VAAIVGAALVAGAARLTFALPGTDLPQSGQTLAVLLVGAALGFRRGVLAILVYLGAAAVGIPVLADGASGVDAMLGPSAGYLLGFLLAAAWVGWAADRDGFVRPWWRILLLMLGAHACLLVLGGGMLIPRIGLARAWSAGVAPFVAGGVVKSLVATAVVYVARGRLPVFGEP